MSNWPNNTNYGHSNWTGSIPRSSQHYQSGYIEGSENPPWGWPVAIALGLIVVGLILFGPTMAARIIGL